MENDGECFDSGRNPGKDGEYTGVVQRDRTQSERGKCCWVCFATEEDEPDAKWINPCLCRGSARWVHVVCLQRWIDEKQANNPTVRVFCPQCNTEYRIKYPSFGPVLIIIDYGDKLLNKVCPALAGGIVLGSLYWSAVTYGAITVMQTVGHKTAFEMMEKEDPLFLLAFLPVIPFGLILGRMVKWDDYLLQLWRKHSPKLSSWIGIKEPEGSVEDSARVPVEGGNGMDFVYSTRVLCGALLLPTFASAFGNYCFKSVHSAFKRTLLGGLVFVAVKGVIRMYFKQQQYLRLCRRTIEEYPQNSSAL
eukprot:gene11946-2518_t